MTGIDHKLDRARRVKWCVNRTADFPFSKAIKNLIAEYGLVEEEGHLDIAIALVSQHTSSDYRVHSWTM